MNKKNILILFVLSALIYSCRKCPTTNELQGTWIEQTDAPDKSKLIFQGDHFYFFHTPSIDSFSYYLDKKKATLNIIPIKSPNTASVGYQVNYHKGKKMLTVMGLFQTLSGDQSVTDYKQ
jgi:hypothetical protein